MDGSDVGQAVRRNKDLFREVMKYIRRAMADSGLVKKCPCCRKMASLHKFDTPDGSLSACRACWQQAVGEVGKIG